MWTNEISYHTILFHIISYHIVSYFIDEIGLWRISLSSPRPVTIKFSREIRASLDLVKLSRLQRNFHEIGFLRRKRLLSQLSYTSPESCYSQPVERILTTFVWDAAWLKNWKTQHFVCLCIHIANWASWKTKNSARPTSLEWHRYHNWSYSLTRFRDIWGLRASNPLPNIWIFPNICSSWPFSLKFLLLTLE